MGAYLEFASAGGVLVPLCVPGPSICLVFLKPQQLHCVPKGRETRPEAERDSSRVTLPGRAGTCRDPAPPGTSPAWAQLFTSRNPGLASAGRPARPPLCGACQEAGAANDLFFWARRTIWSARPQLWSQNNKNKNSKDSWAAWTRESTAPERSC